MPAEPIEVGPPTTNPPRFLDEGGQRTRPAGVGCPDAEIGAHTAPAVCGRDMCHREPIDDLRHGGQDGGELVPVAHQPTTPHTHGTPEPRIGTAQGRLC
jgi:hypothetical protein